MLAVGGGPLRTLQRAGRAFAAAAAELAHAQAGWAGGGAAAQAVGPAALPQPSGTQQPLAAPLQPWRNPAVQEYLPTFKALLVDACGTLLYPVEPAADVYLRTARKYGCHLSAHDVLERYRDAYNQPWGGSPIRYVGDGRPFWRHIVQSSTGCDSQGLFEELYAYYARGDSYALVPGAAEALARIRAGGIKTAVVSNFDSRLPGILADLGAARLFDAVLVSAEVGAEKPSPIIFEAACSALGVAPEQCVHVGDDRRNDLYGARDSGCYAWLWGADVSCFEDVERRLQTGNVWDSLDGV